MNINWGLFPEPEMPPAKKRDKGRVRELKIEAAQTAFLEWQSHNS
jgi:hypothetical protein